MHEKLILLIEIINKLPLSIYLSNYYKYTSFSPSSDHKNMIFALNHATRLLITSVFHL